MKQHLSIRIFSFLLCLVLLSCVPVSAFAVDQSDVDALRAQRDAISAKRQEKQTEVDRLVEEQAGVMERKAAMDERNAYTIQQLQLNREEIALYDEMIADKAHEVEIARTMELEQLAQYRVRVRAMEENGGYGVLSMLLKTTSLGELLTVMDDVGEIMERDREIEEAYIAARENHERVQAEYEEFKTGLEEKRSVLLTEQEELEAEIDEASQLILDLQEHIEENQAEVEEILAAEEAADRELTALIRELERQRQEELERQRQAELERQRQEQAAQPQPVTTGTVVTGTGSWVWPCPGCTYVTSRAGNRYHPVYNEWRYHSGIDVGAQSGTAVVASDGGTVALADVKGGYGNCVMINHGNGYYTLYGHLSSFTVSAGQTVSQGQTIGYVGSTGVSTGPHLHFEIRQGADTPLDPEGVANFAGLTYAPDAGE